ncbi:MAG: GAF domain-containing protein [Planctomycetota bacterium]|jgi:GAF domain-containing protein
MTPDPSPAELKAQLEELSRKYGRLLDELETKSGQLALINGLLKLTASNVTLDQILNVFSKNLKNLCPFDRLDVAIYNPKKKHFDIPVALIGGAIRKNPDEYPRPWGSTIITRVFEERRPLLRTDIRKDFAFDTDRLFVEKGFSTELLFPLEIENRVVGTLDIACFEAGKLTEKHLHTLYEVANAVAVVLHRYLEKNNIPF